MATKRGGRAYYMISAVAQKYNIHPQTLRLYEREGLLKPSRTEGNTRLYSEEDLERLETILSLTRDLGDWEQRLSTAMVKSSPTDLVRAASTTTTETTPVDAEPVDEPRRKP